MTVTVDGCPDGCWLVLGEGYHDAWSASRPTAISARHSSSTAASTGGGSRRSTGPVTVTMHWTAQTPLTIALMLTVAGRPRLHRAVAGRPRRTGADWPRRHRPGSPIGRAARADARAAGSPPSRGSSPPRSSSGRVGARRRRGRRPARVASAGHGSPGASRSASSSSSACHADVVRRERPPPDAGWPVPLRAAARARAVRRRVAARRPFTAPARRRADPVSAPVAAGADRGLAVVAGPSSPSPSPRSSSPPSARWRGAGSPSATTGCILLRAQDVGDGEPPAARHVDVGRR